MNRSLKERPSTLPALPVLGYIPFARAFFLSFPQSGNRYNHRNRLCGGQDQFPETSPTVSKELDHKDGGRSSLLVHGVLVRVNETHSIQLRSNCQTPNNSQFPIAPFGFSHLDLCFLRISITEN